MLNRRKVLIEYLPGDSILDINKDKLVKIIVNEKKNKDRLIRKLLSDLRSLITKIQKDNRDPARSAEYVFFSDKVERIINQSLYDDERRLEYYILRFEKINNKVIYSEETLRYMELRRKRGYIHEE